MMQLSQTREERFPGLDEFTYETRYAGSSVKGHWFLPRGGRETCPVLTMGSAQC
jgi:hypothetical protein